VTVPPASLVAPVRAAESCIVEPTGTGFADSVAVMVGAHGAIGVEVGATKSLISELNVADERLFRNVVALLKPHPVARPDAVRSIAASPNVFAASVWLPAGKWVSVTSGDL
jgi:hypothetical protein